MGIPRLPGLTADREPGEAPSAPASTLAADEGSSRRSFLAKVAVGGAAVTVGSQLFPATRLLPSSGAQEDEVALDEDETRVEFLASVALAAAVVYRNALEGAEGVLPDPVVELARGFGDHHSQQAEELLGLLPEGYEVVANPNLVDEQAATLGEVTDAAGLMAALRDLEDTVAATHHAALGFLASQQDAALVAAAEAVCVQQSSVLGLVAGESLEAVLPEGVQGDQGALTPDSHPIAEPGDTEGGTEPGTEQEGPGGDTTTTANQGGDGPEPGDDGGTGQTGDGTQGGGGAATDDGDGGDDDIDVGGAGTGTDEG